MYDREQILNYIEQLRQASIQAMDAGEFSRGVDLANAAKALQDWLDEGLSGDIPVDLTALLRRKIAEPQPSRSPAEEESQLPPVLTNVRARLSEQDQQLLTLVEDALHKAKARDYQEAEFALRVVVDQAENEILRRHAADQLREVRDAKQKRIEELVHIAELTEREEPNNLVHQRQVWEAVLKVDPNHQGVLVALNRLKQREHRSAWRQQLEELKAPLRMVRKDLRAVEEARRKAYELLLGESVPDPVRGELEEVYQELDELRNDILRATEGGASSERAKDFERAIEIYRSAIRSGYDVIVDDTTGEPINVVEALKRVLRAYWTDLQQRAWGRYNEARDALQRGYPEAAIALLQEAEELLKKVEVGGEDVRRDVDHTLIQAREALVRKQEAQRLVSEVETAKNPEEVLKKLTLARTTYPVYPGLEELITKEERLAAVRTAHEVAIDLSKARAALAHDRFQEARDLCRIALQRGAYLSTPADELESRLHQAEELLREIDEREVLFREITQLLSMARAALSRGEFQEARALVQRVEDLSPAFGELRREMTELREKIDEHEFREVIVREWYPKLAASLRRKGQVTASELTHLLTHQQEGALKAYVADHPHLDLEYIEQDKVLRYRNITTLVAVRQSWYKWVAGDYPDCVPAHRVVDLLCKVTGLHPPETLGNLQFRAVCAFIIDVSPLVEGLKVQPRVPLVLLQTPSLYPDDVTDIRHILKYRFHPPSNIALLILPADQERVEEVRRTLDTGLKLFAIDVVPLGFDGLLQIVLSKRPGRELRRVLLAQVSLTTVSPFTTVGPTPDIMFFGREKELREITEHAATASYAVIGGRRIGKTSILKRLERVRLPDTGFHALYHDCSFTPRQAELVQAVAADKTWFPESPTSPPTSFASVIQALPDDKPIVILLDEADKLVEPDRRAGYPLFNTLRAMANAGRCRFILSGEQALRTELTNPNSPLYNFANEILIGRLDFRAVEELVTRPMKQLEIELADEAEMVQHIRDLTSGHPNVVQRLCQRLIVRLNQRGDRRLTLDDVDAVVVDPDFLRKDFLNIYWERATALERLCSLVMAADESVRTLTAVHETLDRHDIRTTLNEVDDALERLVDLRNILQRTAEGYEFAVAAFPEVIAKTARLDDLIALNRETYQHYGDVEPHSKRGGS